MQVSLDYDEFEVVKDSVRNISYSLEKFSSDYDLPSCREEIQENMLKDPHEGAQAIWQIVQSLYEMKRVLRI